MRAMAHIGQRFNIIIIIIIIITYTAYHKANEGQLELEMIQTGN